MSASCHFPRRRRTKWKDWKDWTQEMELPPVHGPDRGALTIAVDVPMVSTSGVSVAPPLSTAMRDKSATTTARLEQSGTITGSNVTEPVPLATATKNERRVIRLDEDALEIALVLKTVTTSPVTVAPSMPAVLEATSCTTIDHALQLGQDRRSGGTTTKRSASTPARPAIASVTTSKKKTSFHGRKFSRNKNNTS